MNVLEKILEEIEKKRIGMIDMSDEEPELRDVEDWLEEGEKDGKMKAYQEMKEIIQSHMDEASDDDWIPVSERLPEEDDLRFYMCVLENHEEDLPMFCQYNEMYGFGFWSDIYDPISLGFVDAEFSSMDELGYEKVVAWRPLPDPYRPEE